MSVEITPRFMRSDRDPWASRVLSRMDWTLLFASVFLALLGIFFVHSATVHGGSAPSYIFRQLTALGMGIVGMSFFMILPYQVLQTYAKQLFWLSVILLVAVLLAGTRLRGSRSWFNLHWFFFQPVEITRLALAIVVASYSDIHFRDMHNARLLLWPLSMLGLHVGLVLAQPDLSSALVMIPVVLSILYCAGAPLLPLLSLVVMGALAVGIPLGSTYFKLAGDRFQNDAILRWIQSAFLEPRPFFILWSGVLVLIAGGWWFFRKWRVFIPVFHLLTALAVVTAGVAGSFAVKSAIKDYQRKRLVAFLDPTLDPLGAGYNILQSQIAVGSGRFFGKGYQSGSQSQLGFLPEKHTDFIFSLVAEEWGFLGGMLVLLLYLWVVWRAFDIASVARDRFGRYLAVALGVFFAFSALVNIGMVMGLMPVTGLPLPFLSYGGSSLVGTFLAVGLLQSIHLRRYVL